MIPRRVRDNRQQPRTEGALILEPRQRRVRAHERFLRRIFRDVDTASRGGNSARNVLMAAHQLGERVAVAVARATHERRIIGHAHRVKSTRHCIHQIRSLGSRCALEPTGPARGISVVHRSVAVFVLLAVLAACSNGSGSARSTGTTTSSVRATTTAPVEQADRVLVRGSATLDGRPFDSRWVGAVAMQSGLVTPCQLTLTPVTHGEYAVAVLGATEATGCGASGARIALWTYANNKITYSTNTLPWPTSRTVDFAPRYSSATPAGAVPTLTQFNGGVFEGGVELPPGTKVEAFVGSTRCGVASVRSDGDFTGYILNVVGPESIPGCAHGAPITFRVDGRPASPTNITNTPPGVRDSVDLMAH